MSAPQVIQPPHLRGASEASEDPTRLNGVNGDGGGGDGGGDGGGISSNNTSNVKSNGGSIRATPSRRSGIESPPQTQTLMSLLSRRGVRRSNSSTVCGFITAVVHRPAADENDRSATDAVAAHASAVVTSTDAATNSIHSANSARTVGPSGVVRLLSSVPALTADSPSSRIIAHNLSIPLGGIPRDATEATNGRATPGGVKLGGTPLRRRSALRATTSTMSSTPGATPGATPAEIEQFWAEQKGDTEDLLTVSACREEGVWGGTRVLFCTCGWWSVSVWSIRSTTNVFSLS